jgi:glycosyltransferase involved in cell wall biosynthesis
MRVCYITPYPLRSITGVSRVVMQLCKAMKKKGIDHLVITSKDKDEINIQDNINSEEIDVSKLDNFKDVYLAVKTAFTIMRLRKKIDIIHLQSPHLQPMVSAIVGKLLGKPVITTIHGKFPKPSKMAKKPYLWMTIKGTIFFSDEITFVDADSKDHYNVPSGLVIENGIDTERFSHKIELRNSIRSELGLTEDDVVFLYVGRLVANKGVYDVLEAIARIKKETDKKLKLILIGYGESKKIAKKAQSLGLTDDIYLLGVKNDVVPYYCASDVVVLSSAFEGVPMVLLEASACKLAILATRIGGIPTLIKDSENGLLLDYGDKKGLTEKIRILSEDISLRQSMGNNARERIIENYNFENTIDEYEKLYRNMIK